MKSFRNFNTEAWTNEIGKESKEASVTNNNKYNSPTDFKSNAKKVGQIGPLEIHSSENGQGGVSHFTWSPEDRKIHHVIHAVESSNTPEGVTQLKYLSAHKREGSPISMGQIYSHLVKNNNIQFVGTGHSPGAQKMWYRFHDDPDLQVVGRHPNGDIVNLNKDDKMYASKGATDPNEKRIGRMALILRDLNNGSL